MKKNDPNRYKITKIRGKKWKREKETGKLKLVGNDLVRIYDKQIKKAISIDEFANRFNTNRFELGFITHDSLKGDITDFAFYVMDYLNFTFSLDTRELDQLKKYKLYYNAKPVNFDYIENKVATFESQIVINLVKWNLLIEVKSGSANIVIKTDFLENQRQLEAEGAATYTDSHGNFFFMGS